MPNKTKTKKTTTKAKPKAKPVKKVVKKVTKVEAPVKKLPAQKGYAETGQRVELWAYDEYNQGSIVASGDISTVVERAKRFVTEQNVDNALSAAEKNNAWEAFFPIFFNGEKTDYNTLYAGNKRSGAHEVYTYADGKWSRAAANPKARVRFFLGTLWDGKTSKDWYLADHLNREINGLNNQVLERKTVLFLKIV
jgi:hypothetical protein